MKTIDKQEVSNAINQKSEQLGYELGSALSYNSFATLISPEYPIAFVGLNPGGDEYDKPTIESENGKCAYYYENWTAKGENKKTPPDEEELAPLQQQIIKLYTRLAEIFGCDYKTLMDKSIMANLVPFRSPSWNELPNQKAALEFSSQLWSDIFKQTRVKVIICMSVVVFYELDKILRVLGNASVSEESKSESTGWGRTKYQIEKYMANDDSILLIRIPHLSRYKLFNSEGCTASIDSIMREIKQHMA